jgi:hypothetical protein
MKKASFSQRRDAYKLAKGAGLIDSRGRPTKEYHALIYQITGKDRIGVITYEEADRLLYVLETLPKIEQKAKVERKTCAFSMDVHRLMTNLAVAIFITIFLVAIFLGIDYFDGKQAVEETISLRTNGGSETPITTTTHILFSWAPQVSFAVVIACFIGAIVASFVKREAHP